MKSLALVVTMLLGGCAERGATGDNAAVAGGEAANEAASPSADVANVDQPGSGARGGPEKTGAAPTTDEGDAAPGDACRARHYRHLVGQHRSRIPPKPPNAAWRVTCTSCPMTMDHSEGRLNILYDQRTGIIEEVRCG